MSENRRVARQLNRARRLKRRDETWEGTIRLGRVWITPRDKPPYRPYLNMLVSSTGIILRTAILDEPPTPEQVFDMLLHTMRRPTLGAGRPRRPKVVYLDDPEYVTALVPWLADLEVRCEYRRSLPALQDALYAMDRRMNKREPTPGLLRIPSVTAPLVGHLYELAADFFRATPWRWLDDTHPIAIRYLSDDRPRYAVVMGSGGEVFGLAVYDTLDDLRLMYRRDLSPQQTAGMATWFALFFEQAMAIGFDDLDDMEKYGWPVAAENAYPIWGRTTSAAQIVTPTREDLFWMEGALAAILAYLREHKRIERGIVQPTEVTLSVATISDESQIYLRLPAIDWLG